MSVPKWKRSSSRLDAYFEAVKLRHIVTQMIMRSFGLKLPDVKPIISRKFREDHPELARMIAKIDNYQMQQEEARKLESDYDVWLVNKIRDNLFEYSANMVKHISAANEINCKRWQEYEKRILLQDDAICDVANIKQEVNFIEENFDIDLNKYMNYAEQLEKVRKLLYRWKKSTERDYQKYLSELYPMDAEDFGKIK